MIPFIRKLPDGRRVLQEIVRPAHIEAMAHDFIQAGGRFLSEITEAGNVHLMALIDRPNGPQVVADELVDNGTEVPAAVDRLIAEANLFLPPSIMVPNTAPANAA